MPTILKDGPYRLFFYANDRSEPVHVHIERDRFKAKFWIEPVRMADNKGFRPSEMAKIQKIVEKHAQTILEHWHEYFGI